MLTMKKLLILASIALSATTAHAQLGMGAAMSNYNPTQSVWLNPSSIVGTSAYRDIQLVGMGLSLDNNMVYMPGRSFRLLGGAEQYDGSVEPQQNIGPSSHFGQLDVFASGPSFTGVFGRFALGVHTGVRSNVGFRGVSPEMAHYIFQGLGYEPQQDVVHQISDATVSAAAWAEVGITLGASVVQQGKNALHVALTPRRLMGMGAAALRVDDMRFEVGDSSSFNLHNLDAAAAWNEPGWNTGGGWGLNAGFTFIRYKEDIDNYTAFSREQQCQTADYQYRIGFSVLDIGSMSFSNRASHWDVSGLQVSMDNFNNEMPGSMEQLDSMITTSRQMSESESFRMALPTMLSLQFDYNLGKGFYVAGVWMQGVGGGRNFSMHRASLINITPRFELRRFEVSLPFTLAQYQHPRMGIAFRFNSVIIGTDRLGPLFFRSDVFGMDAYVALKYTIFKSQRCKGRVKSRGKMDSTAAVPCPSWD